MVTGDSIQTAKAIALECGILNSDADATEPAVIEGKTFRELSDNEREQVAPMISVCYLVFKYYLFFVLSLTSSKFRRQLHLCLGYGKVFSK